MSATDKPADEMPATEDEQSGQNSVNAESPAELAAILGALKAMKAIEQRACYPPLATRHLPLAPLVPYSLLLNTYTLCMLLCRWRSCAPNSRAAASRPAAKRRNLSPDSSRYDTK